MNVGVGSRFQADDELDVLLRDFMRSQLPQPWPAPPRLLPSATPSQLQPATGRELMRSRWALAASIALLLFGSWLLPSRFTPNATPEHGPNGFLISDKPRDMPKEHQKQKQGEKKPGLAADQGEQPPEREETDMPTLR